MILERINENSYRAEMTMEDLERLDVSIVQLTTGYSPAIDNLMNGILNKIYEKFNSSVDGAALGVRIEFLEDGSLVVYLGVFQESDIQNSGFPEFPSYNYTDVSDDSTDFEIADSSEIFEFRDVEDLISLCKRVANFRTDISSIYHYQGKYYLYVNYRVNLDSGYYNMSESELEYEREMLQDENDQCLDDLTCVIEEYGKASSTTIHVLEEYANCIVKDNAFEKFAEVFR